MRTALLIFLVGVATFYPAADYEGKVLYWSTPEEPLYYHKETVPWIAVPVEFYSKGWQKGDLVIVTFLELGVRRRFRALDAGPLSDYYIEDYAALPLVADIPEYYWPFSDRLSTAITLYNASLDRRIYEPFMTGSIRD